MSDLEEEWKPKVFPKIESKELRSMSSGDRREVGGMQDMGGLDKKKGRVEGLK